VQNCEIREQQRKINGRLMAQQIYIRNNLKMVYKLKIYKKKSVQICEIREQQRKINGRLMAQQIYIRNNLKRFIN
jgi:hypothetical protein